MPVSAGEGRSPARTAARSETPYADFLPLRSPRGITEPPAVAGDEHWQATAVAALAAAIESALASSAALQTLGGNAPPVDVGPSLKAKVRNNKAYKAFVDAVVDACRSPRAVSLGTTRYAIEEKRDVENPRWVTITLTAWFRDPDFDARMDKWTEMRNIVDGYTAQAMDGDDKAEMLDINSRFFISVGSKYD